MVTDGTTDEGLRLSLFNRFLTPKAQNWIIAVGLLSLLAVALLRCVPTLLGAIMGKMGGGSVSFTALILSPDEYPRAKEIGSAYSMDISRLDLTGIADNSDDFPNASPLLLLENGKPLEPHIMHADMRNAVKRGGFSHWGNQLIFAPFDDGDVNKNVYTLALPVAGKPYDEKAAQSQLFNRIHRRVWAVAIAVNLLACVILWRRYAANIPSRLKAVYYAIFSVSVFLIMLGGVSMLAPNEPQKWDVFYVNPDTQGYVQRFTHNSYRPPLVSLFTHLVTAGSGYDGAVAGLPNNTPIRNSSHPLLRVVKGQKILLCISMIVALIVTAFHIGPVLSALLYLWLYDSNRLSFYSSVMISEPITEALALFTIAAFGAFLLKGKKPLLLIAAVTAAAMFMARPAAIYGMIFPGVMMLWALWISWREYCKTSLAAVLLAGCLVSLQPAYVYYKTGALTPSPLHSWGKMAFALEVAKPEDVNLLQSDGARRFFERAMEIKKAKDRELRKLYKSERELLWYALNSNLYQVALPAIVQTAGSSNEKIFQEVNSLILSKRRMEYVIFGLESIRIATTGDFPVTSLHVWKFGFWHIAFALLAVAAVTRGAAGLFASTLILAHIAHLVVICYHDAPLSRYVHATEFMVIIAAMVLLPATLSKLVNRFSRRPETAPCPA